MPCFVVRVDHLTQQSRKQKGAQSWLEFPYPGASMVQKMAKPMAPMKHMRVVEVENRRLQAVSPVVPP